MPFLPYSRITFRTSLPLEQIRLRLKENITEITFRRRSLRFLTHPFRGEVEDYQFKIARNTIRRTAFLPIIKGHIDSEESSTKISLYMELHPIVKTLFIIWLLGLLIGSILGITSNSGAVIFKILTLACPFFIILSYVNMRLTFYYESRKALKILLKILSGKDVVEEE